MQRCGGGWRDLLPLQLSPWSTNLGDRCRDRQPWLAHHAAQGRCCHVLVSSTVASLHRIDCLHASMRAVPALHGKWPLRTRTCMHTNCVHAWAGHRSVMARRSAHPCIQRSLWSLATSGSAADGSPRLPPLRGPPAAAWTLHLLPVRMRSRAALSLNYSCMQRKPCGCMHDSGTAIC